MKYNTKGYQVLTDSGFRPFVGVAVMNEKSDTIRLEFDGGTSISVTELHKFITNVTLFGGVSRGVEVHAKSLSVGDTIATADGEVAIVSIDYNSEQQPTYDLIEVGGNQYLTNGVVSHNCEFLSSDPLLIDSMILNQLENQVTAPIREDMGFQFWQELKPNKTYIVGVDPATGSGEDFTTIQVYDFHDMSIVTEYRTNTVSSPSAYASLKLMLNKIGSVGSKSLFSIENNGVGEGMIALYESDETFPESADMVSEDGKDKLGMRTESRVKLRTCLKLKQLIESGTIKVKSDRLLQELKSFVASKGSYEARRGATDDLISSLLVIIRVLEEMAQYDQKAFDKMNDYQDTGKFADDGVTDDSYDDSYEPDGMII